MQKSTARKKRILTIAVTLALMASFFAINYEPPVAQTLSKYGSRGNEVRLIQNRLRTLGYYNAGVDGIYGVKTRDAVRRFQRAKKLTADGIVGPRTMKALGLTNGPTITAAESALLARVISAEARGESYQGQVAVGAVILNRLRHPSFPNSISGVVYQKGAFTCMTDGQINKPVAASAVRAAKDAINGADPSGGAIYYYNPKTAKSAWIRSRQAIKTIGRHRFCI